MQAAGQGVEATPQLLAVLAATMRNDIWLSDTDPKPIITVATSVNRSHVSGCGAAPSSDDGDDDGQSSDYSAMSGVTVTEQSMTLTSETSMAGRRRKLRAALANEAGTGTIQQRRKLQDCR